MSTDETIYLETATEEEIASELSRRYPAVALLLVKPEKIGDDIGLSAIFKGNIWACRGAIEYARQRFIHQDLLDLNDEIHMDDFSNDSDDSDDEPSTDNP